MVISMVGSMYILFSRLARTTDIFDTKLVCNIKFIKQHKNTNCEVQHEYHITHNLLMTNFNEWFHRISKHE
jgi:hypothetical protein